jgi:3D (Asp-Asp-Asp) domain-containing protein/peptidoglycan hydrolase CwlO-like protein
LSGRGTRRTAQLAALAGLAGLAAAAVAAAATPPHRQQAHRLAKSAQRLDDRAHRALLDLYSLDAQLHSAHVRVGALAKATARLQRRRATLRAELDAARTTFLASQQDLALHLRSLYERGTVDPLAVVLGATSLQDAVGRLDALTQVAEQNREVLDAAATARHGLLRVRTRLGREQSQLAQALRAARGAEQGLEQARAARLAYIGRLREQARLQRAQVDALVSQASRIQQKSQTLQPPPAQDGSGSSGSGSGGDPAPPPGSGRKLLVSATCYSLPGHTASGMPVGLGVVAVDPTVIPLGTKLYVPGYGKGVAADVGSGIKGAKIDLWMPYAQCMQWGRRTVTITIY